MAKTQSTSQSSVEEGLPKNKDYPPNSVQCVICKGEGGCKTCGDNGWLTPHDHESGRRCSVVSVKRACIPHGLMSIVPRGADS